MVCGAVNAMQFASYVNLYAAYPGKGVKRSCGQGRHADSYLFAQGRMN